MITTADFQHEDATWSVNQGISVRLKASQLTSDHVGRGLYRQMYRDCDWLYISDVSPHSDGRVDVTYLEPVQADETSGQYNKKVETTVYRNKRHVITLNANDDVVIKAEPVTRVPSKRIIITTTTEEEAIDD